MDFAKKYSRAKRAGKLKFNPAWLIASTVGMLVVIAGIYIYKHASLSNGIVARNISSVKSWLTERKNNLQQRSITKPKKVVLKSPIDDSQIHFEFYTALSDSQISVPTPEIIPEESMVKKTTRNSLAANVIFTNPEELEKELSEKIKQAHAQNR